MKLWKPGPRARRDRRRKSAETEGQRHARGSLQNEGAEARAERRREAGQKAGRKERQETKGASPPSSAGAGRRQEG